MHALRHPETLPGPPSWKGRVVLRMFRYVGTEEDDPMSSQTGPGTTRGVEYGSFWSGSTCHWFLELPTEWSALGDWWTDAVEAIESALVAAGHTRAPERL